jgi:hypothetical protein
MEKKEEKRREAGFAKLCGRKASLFGKELSESSRFRVGKERGVTCCIPEAWGSFYRTAMYN